MPNNLRRFSVFGIAVIAGFCLSLAAVFFPGLIVLAAPFVALSLLGIYDLFQKRHSVTRNYPVIGHMRFLIEGIGPEIRQYLIESEHDETPFSRDKRAIVYQRAKNTEDKRPFGSRLNMYEPGFAWLNHSFRPRIIDNADFRTRIGGPDCTQPYDASVYNISAMSFGALSANAVLALSNGARMGGFALDTGEGGISRYHREGGGDLIYEVGTGYFGCRDEQGRFDARAFAEQARHPRVKMIEVKLSQGAKPGHGGMLPAAKISAEIAEARGVPMGRDCISPAAHSAFSTPLELCAFLAELRRHSGGKPVGFKLCIGHRREFMCIVKAMIETDIVPDFIVVDGAEGGTGAAPQEFANHIGMPLRDGLHFVHNVLRGAGLRDRVSLGASGKLITAFDLASAFSLGADWCNSARGYMFAIGCIQAQACHTNACPVGIATQDKLRQRALHVPNKAQRVANFHRNTLRALADMVGTAGQAHPRDLLPRHFMLRTRRGDMRSGESTHPWLPEGFLLRGEEVGRGYLDRWNRATADRFEPFD